MRMLSPGPDISALGGQESTTSAVTGYAARAIRAHKVYGVVIAGTFVSPVDCVRKDELFGYAFSRTVASPWR